MKTLLSFAAVILVVVVSFCGCAETRESNSVGPAATSETAEASNAVETKIALISITSDPNDDPQAVNMGLTFAGFCADEGYEVAIFFNVKGTKLPTKSFDKQFAYQSHAPMAQQLIKLNKRGVEMHVCPVCMGDLEIGKDQIVEEAFVTSKPKLFAKLGANTMVFTY